MSATDPYAIAGDEPAQAEPLSHADFMAKVREYGRLRALEKARTAAAEEIKEEADKLERDLLEEWIEFGQQSIKTTDGQTVFLRRQLWAKVEPGVDRREVLDGLVAAGHPEFVSENFNSSTVSAWLRELDKNGEEIPAELRGKLGTSEVFNLRVRKS